MIRIVLVAAVTSTLAVMAACDSGTGLGNGDYPSLCATGCERALEDGEERMCGSELDACRATCAEVTNGVNSLCATCLVDDMNTVYFDVEYDECVPAEFDGYWCAEECGTAAE